MNKRIVVVFPREDEWMFECLTKIVETKKAMGMKSTLSFELLRLAKNGLTNGLKGVELDRRILVVPTKKPD